MARVGRGATEGASPREPIIDQAKLGKDGIPAMPFDRAASRCLAHNRHVTLEQGLDGVGERCSLRGHRKLPDRCIHRLGDLLTDTPTTGRPQAMASSTINPKGSLSLA